MSICTKKASRHGNCRLIDGRFECKRKGSFCPFQSSPSRRMMSIDHGDERDYGAWRKTTRPRDGKGYACEGSVLCRRPMSHEI